MKPDKLSVQDLFHKERRYVVPLYQRPYVWGQDEQWAPLWDDIERQAEACFAVGEAGAKRSHFLGAVVLNVSKLVGSGVARSEVIDGQQRLTTLQIFLAALRDHAEANNSQYAARLRRLTEHEDEKRGSEASFKVWPTNADREIFRKVMTAGSAANLLKAFGGARSAAPRMAAAYFFFFDRIGDHLALAEGNQETRERRIESLRQALRVALQLVVIELEEEDDPQVIFETLNARGQPLLPSDLIRNYLFLQAANERDDEPDALYEQYWRSFDDVRLATPVNGEDRFWHVEERQGRLTRPRIDLFLFHYLVMKTEGELNIGQLFREFRDWRSTHQGSIEALLADIKAHAEIFQRLIEPTGGDRAAVFAKRLKALDNSTVYPLLLYVLSAPSDRLSTASRDRLIEDLESWLVRRFVCGATNKNYNKFFVQLLTKVRQAADDVDLADVVRAELTRSPDPTTVWPSDEEFLSAWLSKPLYAKSRPDRSAMVLRAIEERARTRRNEAIGLPDRLSVEHLLPQKGSLEDYPFAAAMPRKDNESDSLCRERLIHTIGNLTLLTGELNASVSNGAVGAKVVAIIKDSDLRLNAWLRLSPPSAWSETDIVARGEVLFESALELWPRPETGPENLEDEDPASGKGQWRFTDSATIQTMRNAVLNAFATAQAVTLQSETVAKHRDPSGATRCVVALSKRYDDRSAFPYWYAHHPDSQTYIAEAERGFLLLGCMDRQEAFAIPSAVVAECISALNTTTRRKTGRLHWHMHLVERSGGLALLLPKTQSVLDVTPYRIALAVAPYQGEPVSA
jgi:hypothetical protein